MQSNHQVFVQYGPGEAIKLKFWINQVWIDYKILKEIELGIPLLKDHPV